MPTVSINTPPAGDPCVKLKGAADLQKFNSVVEGDHVTGAAVCIAADVLAAHCVVAPLKPYDTGITPFWAKVGFIKYV